MKAINEFILITPFGGSWQQVSMPSDAHVFQVTPSGADLSLWAICDPGALPVFRYFRVCEEGNILPDDVVPDDYLGTAQMNGQTLHVFEVTQ